MKVVIINKSDERGGAAVVSRRLMHALREQGVDAQMLVCEKLTSDPHVHLAASPSKIKRAFLAERLEVFLYNGFNRRDLFKADIASAGLPLASHPLVREADIVLLGWVNQGMLSFKEIGRMAKQKPLVWVMHDMWCATGLCHHAGSCKYYQTDCHKCPLLHWMKGWSDLSFTTWMRKKRLYDKRPMTFVAVSNWLKEKCRESTLLALQDVRVIHNPVSLPFYRYTPRPDDGKFHLLMTAARLDDEVKGLDTLRYALKYMFKHLPDAKGNITLTLVGALKNEEYKAQFAEIEGLTTVWHDAVPVSEIPSFYKEAHILVSPSSYETLPGTLVEAQMYGALPVAFHSGGQRDIITNNGIGVLALRTGNHAEDVAAFAQAIIIAADMVKTTNPRSLAYNMYASVSDNFAAPVIAKQYIDLFNELIKK